MAILRTDRPCERTATDFNCADCPEEESCPYDGEERSEEEEEEI
jgi:hypothetical protein